MIVVDASALVDALVEGPRTEEVLRLLETSGPVVAPDLALTDVASALWRLVRGDLLTSEAATTGVEAVGRMNLDLVSSRPLLPVAWSLRESVRISDAFYLACAQVLGVSLLTCDARLARGHHGVPTTLVS